MTITSEAMTVAVKVRIRLVLPSKRSRLSHISLSRKSLKSGGFARTQFEICLRTNPALSESSAQSRDLNVRTRLLEFREVCLIGYIAECRQ